MENIPRILPQGLGVKIHRNTWDILPIFTIMQEIAQISDFEMYRAFNMGIGMVIIGDISIGDKMAQLAQSHPETQLKTIGAVTATGTVDIV